MFSVLWRTGRTPGKHISPKKNTKATKKKAHIRHGNTHTQDTKTHTRNGNTHLAKGERLDHLVLLGDGQHERSEGGEVFLHGPPRDLDDLLREPDAVVS